VKPGQKHPVKIEDSDVLHLSQACLHEPKDGKNYLQVEVDGTSYSIACLEKGKREHDCLDLFFDSKKTSFTCKGNSEIHLMGYIEPSDLGSEGSESESQQVVTKAVSPKKVVASSPKITATSPKTSPKAAPVAEESDDDFSEDEEEEEEQMASDGDSFMEDEEEESESPAQPPAKPAQSPKRQAPSEPQAPAAKKAKGEVSGEEKAYVQKLVDYLKANGKQNGGQLGSKVPRPAGVPKMKAVLETHKDKFSVVGDVISLK